MTAAISINNLKKVYANGFEALKGIDLEVQQGDFFALLGPNGAGKSTIIGIICSLVNKSSGSVSIFGKSIDTDLSAAKSYIGLVPQEFNFNMFEPVAEIVINQAGYYGIERSEATRRAEKLLKKLGLWDKRKDMARNLSGGMKRRLMIARSLVHKPQLLILDEPTAGVDIEIRHTMWEFLEKINQQGTTIILTTHNLEEAENLCKNIAIIDEGKIIENTSLKSLLSQLSAETFILDLSTEIKSLPQDSPYRCRLIDSTTIEVEVQKTQDINALFESFTQHGIKVCSMRNKVNRLEELFLRLLNKDNDSNNNDKGEQS